MRCRMRKHISVTSEESRMGDFGIRTLVIGAVHWESAAVVEIVGK
jgi:hypothetical protein